jgi:hypothetical protein
MKKKSLKPEDGDTSRDRPKKASSKFSSRRSEKSKKKALSRLLYTTSPLSTLRKIPPLPKTERKTPARDNSDTNSASKRHAQTTSQVDLHLL